MAWVVFPAMMFVLCAGAGLLVRRAAGARAVPAVLVLPTGLALLAVIGGLLCYYAALAPLTAPAFVVVAVVGLLLDRRQVAALLRPRGWRVGLWPAAAAAGAALIIAAPVVLSGKPGFTGYAHIVDISYEFDLAAHFSHAGRSLPGAATSAYQVVLNKYLASGYPGGGTWTLGAMSNLTPVDLSWLYQPFLAFLAAMSALSLYSMLARLVEPRGWRALGAFIASQPSVLVGYALGGGIKELSTSCFLLLSGALLARIVPRLRVGRSTLAVPIGMAATFASLTLVTLPWLGLLGAGACATALLLRRSWPGRLTALAGSAQMLAVLALLSLPTLAASIKLLPAVKGSGPVDLGNLAAPMPGIAAAGVWISGDIRFPQYAHRGLSEGVDILVLVLAAIGLLYALKRRAWGVVWLGIAGGAALYYVAHRYGPWIQFKADCITASIALLLAFAGIGALMRMTKHVSVGALVAVVLGAAVLGGNALLYHDVTLAPYTRLHNLEYIGERFAGQGPTLTPDFEEYAEYYLRDDNQTSVVNGPSLALRAGVNRATEPGGIFQYDVNELEPRWLEGFRTIVMRRSPVASRPPSNYRLVYLSSYYAVWQRTAPSSTLFAHVAVPEAPGKGRSIACAEVSALARKAGRHARIGYTGPLSGYVQVDASNSVITGALQATGGVILAQGAGQASREQPIPAAGTYDFYLSGSFGRPVGVSVDRHKVGTAAYQVSYPGQWLLLGSRRLSRAVHKVQITRGGRSLHPGNGDGIDGFNRTIGPLVIVPARPVTAVVHYASAIGFARICRSPVPLRWAEVLRP